MVSQQEVKIALHELGGRAIIEEIVNLLYLKKKIDKSYEISTCTAVNRRLQALRSWGEVDRIIYSHTDHPKTTTQDVWFIVKEKI